MPLVRQPATAGLAKFSDNPGSLGGGQLCCNFVHSRLAPESCSQGHGKRFPAQEGAPSSQSSRVNGIESESDFFQGWQIKPPAMAQIRSGFQRTVISPVIVQRHFLRICRRVENLKIRATGIIGMKQGKALFLPENQYLGDPVESGCEGVFQKFAQRIRAKHDSLSDTNGVFSNENPCGESQPFNQIARRRLTCSRAMDF